MLAMLIRDNANIDNKAMFEEFQEQILKKLRHYIIKIALM